jgi:hypothetical protein
MSGSKWKFARLALFAPPADFFRRPGALGSVNAPIRIWAGGKDQVRPPTQSAFLKRALASQAPVEVRLDEDAGRFTYMDEPPPHDHAAKLRPIYKWIVAKTGHAIMVNPSMVNRSAPEILPSAFILKKSCTRRSTKERGGLRPDGINHYKPLKINKVSSLTNCQLNEVRVCASRSRSSNSVGLTK